MATLAVTVGLTGSRKSDYCKALVKETGAQLVSVSETRYELRAENPDVTESEVFGEVHNLVKNYLTYGYDVVLDGSHVTSNSRKWLLKDIKSLMPGIPFKTACIIVATPIEKCFFNNILKGKKVSNEVVGSMFRRWQTPMYWEGWNEIWCYYDNPAWIGMRGPVGGFAEDHINYDLGDKDHFDSLGGHCNSVHNHLLKYVNNGNEQMVRTKTLLSTSLIHDCGKPIIRTDCDGKPLYYNHANVGAYEALFYEMEDGVDPVYMSGLISYHMLPYDWERKENGRINAVVKYGGEFTSDLELLHQADVAAKENT